MARQSQQARGQAYDALARRDDVLARLIARLGRPDPLSWEVVDQAVDGDAFAELVLHIVSQQISTRAALTIYARLRASLGGGVEPAQIAVMPVDELRAAGLSNAKARSLRELAER